MKWKSMIGFLHPEKASVVQNLIRQYVTDRSTCLEIGIFCGKSLMHLLENSTPKKVYAIDPFEGNINTQMILNDNASNHSLFSFDEIDNSQHYNYDKVSKNFSSFENVEIIQGYSPIPSLDISNINYAYIDGDHSFTGATNDLDWVFSNMTSGVIVIDDYAIDSVKDAVDQFIKNHNLQLHTSTPSHLNNLIAWIIIQ